MMDVLKIDRAHLIGNAMGGHSAVAFAFADLSRVGKLVFMGGGTGGISSFVPMPTERIKLIGALCRDPNNENLRRMMNVYVYDASALKEDLPPVPTAIRLYAQSAPAVPLQQSPQREANVDIS